MCGPRLTLQPFRSHIDHEESQLVNFRPRELSFAVKRLACFKADLMQDSVLGSQVKLVFGYQKAVNVGMFG